jgi:CDP-diacylglycerol--serine O-phosphatidyltransferase
VNYLANVITGLSLLFGFLSIILSLESHFTFASWAIIVSVIFDGLDGQIARINQVPTVFGKELDSLVDVVSFGIAPSILGYVFIYGHFQFWAAASLFIYLACSVFRLAKYNVAANEGIAYYFTGLPTTVAGGILAAFVLIYRKKQDMMTPEYLPDFLLPEFIPIIFLSIVLLLSFLMISRIKYLNLDGLRRLLNGQAGLFVLAIALILITALPVNKAGITLFAIFLIYLIFSPFMVKRLDKILPR